MSAAPVGRLKRLSGRRSFERIFRQGRPLRAEWLAVNVLPNGTRQTRFGCTVSRATAGAVQRNRLKRWMREAFRRNQASIPAGLDLVVRMRGIPTEVSYHLVEEQFRLLCEKI